MEIIRRRCAAITCSLLAVGVVLLLCTLAAGQEKIILQYYTWGSDIQTKEAEEYLFQHFTERYPHVHIEVSLTGSVSDHVEKITVMHASGVAPDLFTISGSAGDTPHFYDTGMVLDLTPYAERDQFDFDAFIPGAWAYTWRNERLWSFPRATKGTAYATGVLVYNRSLFEASGLRYPWSGWTFDEFADTAKKLTRYVSGSDTPEVWGVTFAPNDWYRFVWSNGGELLNEDGTQVLLDTEESLEALEWYANWQTEFAFAGGSFERQTAAMSYKSTTGFLRTAPPELDWAFAESPRGPRGERSYTLGGSNVVAISSQTKHPEEAWLFLKFLLSEENQEREVFELGVGTASLRTIAFSPQHIFRDGPPYDLTPILLQATKPWPQSVGWKEAVNVINQGLMPAWTGQKAVRTAVSEMMGTLDAIMKRN